MNGGIAVRALLLASPTVAAIVNQAIYPIIAPDEALPPYITYEEFDGMRPSAMGQDANIDFSRVRVHYWQTTYLLATQLADAGRKAVQRCGTGVFGGVSVDDIFIIAGGEEMIDPNTRNYHFVRDFRVIYRDD